MPWRLHYAGPARTNFTAAEVPSSRRKQCHLHRKLWIFASFGLTVLGFHAVPWHSHGVVHRVYGLVYRLLITLPYAADLGVAWAARWGFAVARVEGASGGPVCPTQPYRSMGQCGTQRDGLEVGLVSGGDEAGVAGLPP